MSRGWPLAAGLAGTSLAVASLRGLGPLLLNKASLLKSCQDRSGVGLGLTLIGRERLTNHFHAALVQGSS